MRYNLLGVVNRRRSGIQYGGKHMAWKKGRGRLGPFNELIGVWFAEVQSDDMGGLVVCRRTFAKTLDGKYVQLDANWTYPRGSYDELALIGVNGDKEVAFWSFTSDGKQSTGVLAEAADIHPEAIGFEAQMDMGLARQVYWPDDDGGFYWCVENHTKKGWNRFVEHHYRPVA